MNEVDANDLFTLEDGDEYDRCCGEIYLTLKGNIIFHCTLCNNKYKDFVNYATHVAENHWTVICPEEAMSDIIEVCTDEDYYNENVTEAEDDDEMQLEMLEDVEFLASIKGTMIQNEKTSNEDKAEDPSTATIESKPIRKPTKKTTFKAAQSREKSIVKSLNNCENESSFISHTSTAKGSATEKSDLQLLSDGEQTISNSSFEAELYNIGNPLLDPDNKLDPSLYHELPSCDRPKLNRSRKPCTSVSDEARKHKCPYCKFASTDKTNLWSHIQRHSNNKPHECDYCPKSFHTRVELTFHTRYHTKERPFLCTECGRTFVTKAQLKQHTKRHNNQRDHKCPECEKCFYSNQEVREHMSVHTKETPYQCDLCGGAFTRRKALNAHKKLHENKRSYKCKFCDSGFNQSAGLYLHIKTKHQNSKCTEDS